MTGLMHEKEFSRKSFVKGGGALIVGFSALGVMSGKASAANANTPFAQRGPQDFLPDQTQVDSWITMNADNTVTVTHGETELGHGTPTGVLMLVAEEMNMNMTQMKFAHVESWLQAVGGGSGSGGISSRSTAIRAAAALAKTTLLNLAATKLGVAASSLTVTDGVVSAPSGATVKYGDLLGGKLFNAQLTAANGGTTAIPGAGNTKAVKDYSFAVGKSFPRIDIPAKVAATYTYVQNVHIPGMLHARTVRPRGAGANTVENSTPLSVDATSISHIPGAQVVQLNNYIAVVAPKEYDAIQAAAQLKVVWDTKQGLPGSGNFWSWLRTAGDTNTTNPARYTTQNGDPTVTLKGAAKTVSATYTYHYNGFMPIGPHCAVADVRADLNRATIYVQAQAINGLPASLVQVINAVTGGTMPAANCRVIWYEGASSFGGGQTGEVNEQAAILSAKLGKPVRVQWMRWDQHGWDHYGVASMMDGTIGADAAGNIISSDWVTYSQAQSNIDETRRAMTTLLSPATTWAAVPGSGGLAPTDSAVYAKGWQNTSRRVLAKTQPLYGGAFKGNFLRAPNAPQQYFPSEQLVDELAYAMKMDPIAFRRQNIDATTTAGQRWLAVLDGSTIAAGWKAKVANSTAQTGNVRTGRGYAFGTFASTQVGLVADIEVNMKSGRIFAKQLYIAQNNGITNGPQLVANQMSGSAIQGLSRAIWEQPTFNKERTTSLDWVSYPILRFRDSPAVTLVNVHPGEYVTVNPDLAAGGLTSDVTKGNTNAFNQGWTLTGSGEPPTAAIAAAVGNAFFDATGVRIRMAPMSPTHVRATLKAAGAIA